MLRHQAAARAGRQYDANNTYQYIIDREDMQLSWVGRRRSWNSAVMCRQIPSRSHDGTTDPGELNVFLGLTMYW